MNWWTWLGLWLLVVSGSVQAYFFYLALDYLSVIQSLLGGGCLE
jgi:hypothetical protein